MTPSTENHSPAHLCQSNTNPEKVRGQGSGPIKINWHMVGVLAALGLFWAYAVPYVTTVFIGLLISIGSIFLQI